MNWQAQRQFDRMVEQLEKELEEGTISQSDFNAEMRELEREYRDMAQEAAKDEYNSWF